MADDTVDDARQRLAYVLDDYWDTLSDVPAVQAAIDALIAAVRAETPQTDTQWAHERAATVRILRRVCAEFGDPDWPDDLHLEDVIDKYLWRYLKERRDQRPSLPDLR